MAVTQGSYSSVDSVGACYSLHQLDEAAKRLPPLKIIDIPEFYNLIGAESEEGAGSRKNRRGSQQHRQAGNPFEDPGAFVHVLESCLKGLDDNALRIEIGGSQTPTGHPTGPLARPDIAIFREGFSVNEDEDKVFWGSIEIAIEFHSAGKTTEECLSQAATYVLYLLEARPDLVSALGLLVEPKHLDFLFCNADGINILKLSDEDHYLQVLSAVVEYLNHGQTKNLDSTLSRARHTDRFDVSVPNEMSSLGDSEGGLTEFKNCTLRYSRSPFGRRPNIFTTESGNQVHAIRVIKDQYIRKGRRWTEKEILDKIHASGIYPAVVRMCFAGTIPGAACGDRIRVRIALQDYGTDFLSLKTPRDAIYALYDLLEVTRSLYFDRKILHRDISPGNIMVREAGDTEVIDTCASSSPVFIRHLLDPQVPKHKSSIFLIDFGYSQDFESSKPSCDEGVGTPMFIARAVQAGEPLPPYRLMDFPALPRLSEDIESVYKANHPERMKLHELRHDGESGVWTFFWWGLLASPEKGRDLPINLTNWSAFAPIYYGPRTGLPDADDREAVIDNLIARRKTFLHPGYADLLSLFSDIATAIKPDYHWADGTIRQRPDFVHELLQRVILNFILKNDRALVIDKNKSDINRAPFPISRTRYWSTPETDARCAKSFTTSTSSKNRKRKLKEITTISTASGPPVANSDDDDTERLRKRPRMRNMPETDVQAE